MTKIIIIWWTRFSSHCLLMCKRHNITNQNGDKITFILFFTDDSKDWVRTAKGRNRRHSRNLYPDDCSCWSITVRQFTIKSPIRSHLFYLCTCWRLNYKKGYIIHLVKYMFNYLFRQKADRIEFIFKLVITYLNMSTINFPCFSILPLDFKLYQVGSNLIFNKKKSKIIKTFNYSITN